MRIPGFLPYSSINGIHIHTHIHLYSPTLEAIVAQASCSCLAPVKVRRLSLWRYGKWVINKRAHDKSTHREVRCQQKCHRLFQMFCNIPKICLLQTWGEIDLRYEVWTLPIHGAYDPFFWPRKAVGQNSALRESKSLSRNSQPFAPHQCRKMNLPLPSVFFQLGLEIFVSFFSSDWYCFFFQKQFPIFFQLHSDELFPSNPSSSFFIFSRGLGDKCTPGASAKSQKRGYVGEVVCKRKWGTLLWALKRPSSELTYPLKSPFWRWFSFSPGGIC